MVDFNSKKDPCLKLGIQLPAESLNKLKTVIKDDYEIDLTDEEANLLGFSLLKLSRLAGITLNNN